MVARTNHSFDSRSLDLAVYFMLDDDHPSAQADDLAQVIQDAVEGYFEGLDPTPWCAPCGAKRQADCKCGPIARNE